MATDNSGLEEPRARIIILNVDVKIISKNADLLLAMHRALAVVEEG